MSYQNQLQTIWAKMPAWLWDREQEREREWRLFMVSNWWSIRMQRIGIERSNDVRSMRCLLEGSGVFAFCRKCQNSKKKKRKHNLLVTGNSRRDAKNKKEAHCKYIQIGCVQLQLAMCRWRSANSPNKNDSYVCISQQQLGHCHWYACWRYNRHLFIINFC